MFLSYGWKGDQRGLQEVQPLQLPTIPRPLLWASGFLRKLFISGLAFSQKLEPLMFFFFVFRPPRDSGEPQTLRVLGFGIQDCLQF